MNTQPASSQIVLAAPMSFTGVTQRTMNYVRANKQTNKVMRVVFPVLVAAFLATAYCAIGCWYFTFGLLLVPFRLVRRSSRKSKRGAAQHSELMAQATYQSQLAYYQATKNQNDAA